MLLLLVCAAGAAGCAEAPAPRASVAPPAVRSLEVPAGPGSAQPFLYAEGERVLLSWVEPVDSGRTALRVARLDENVWAAPVEAARGAGWFVNWADVPSVVVAGGHTLAAHYLVRSGDAPYAYDVHVVRSPDGGATWRPSVVPHTDGTPTEHGFASLLPLPDERLGVVWLDGRAYAGAATGHDGHGAAGGHTALRYAALAPDGSRTDEAVLDERTCDCCPTAAVQTPDGFVVAYRDRSADELRDVYVVRLTEGRWTAPAPIHADGWRIEGCPVNGPALAAHGTRVAAAWFTAAEERPRVQVSFSADGGARFGTPVIVSDERPSGRVGLVMLRDGSAVVSWIEADDAGAALLARRVYADGRMEAPRTVARTDGSRAAGIPRIARRGEQVIFAWTEPGEPSHVRTAVTTFTP